MTFHLRKIFFNSIFNICLFLILIVGIQNSSNKSNVNFMIDKTIKLPISFIVGISFISGSITGSFFPMTIHSKRDQNL